MRPGAPAPLISPRRSAKPPQVSNVRTLGRIAARTSMLSPARTANAAGVFGLIR